MKLRTLIIFSLATKLVLATELCSELENKLEQNCIIPISKAHPTQFTLGMLSIKKKRRKIEKSFKRKELNLKLMNKVIPAIIGPDQKYYILDGHHSTYALFRAKIPSQNKVILVSIKKDCSACSQEKFKELMTQDGNSYLYCSEFIKRDFYELPNSLSDLEDNPYRSLSWILREQACYKKVNINYLEFIWAKVLKAEFELKRINLKSSKKSEIDKVKNLACKIVKSKKYSSYPGYVSKK